MAQRIMANVDVKLGIKSILSRVEAAYARRSQVISRIHGQHAFDSHIFEFSFEGYQNVQTDASGGQQNQAN